MWTHRFTPVVIARFKRATQYPMPKAVAFGSSTSSVCDDWVARLKRAMTTCGE